MKRTRQTILFFALLISLTSWAQADVESVAERCGYTLMTNFTRAFVRFYGFKPSELRLQKTNTDFTLPHMRRAT